MNKSKVRDPRWQKKWRESGAIGTYSPPTLDDNKWYDKMRMQAAQRYHSLPDPLGLKKKGWTRDRIDPSIWTFPLSKLAR